MQHAHGSRLGEDPGEPARQRTERFRHGPRLQSRPPSALTYPYASQIKPPAPRILRKGAVVRIAGASDDRAAVASAYAISFVDLQFTDGHVERWLGSGSLRD